MSLCMYVMPDTCLSGTGFGVRFESFSGVQIEAISGVQNEVPTRSGSAVPTEANKQKTDPTGRSPLHTATVGGHFAVVRFLIEAGAEPAPYVV